MDPQSSPASQASELSISLRGTQDAVLKIHEHLVDISRLVCQTNDELAQQQSNYKQAYLSEHRKLLEVAANQNALADANQRLEEENSYLKLQLIPQYESTLKRQGEVVVELQILVKGLETKLLVLEKVNGDEQRQHARAIESATSLLNMQIQNIKDLKREIEQRSTGCSTTPLKVQGGSQPRRSGRLTSSKAARVVEHSARMKGEGSST